MKVSPSVINSPATNSVTSSAATPVNSAVPNAAAAGSTPVSPAYPTGQTGLLESFDIATPTQVTLQSLMMVYQTGSTKSFEGFEFLNANFSLLLGL